MHALRRGARVAAATVAQHRPLERLLSTNGSTRYLHQSCSPVSWTGFSASPPRALVGMRHFSSTMDSNQTSGQEAGAAAAGNYPESIIMEEFSDLPEALKRVLSLENASQREKNKFELRQAMKQNQLHATDTGSPEAQIAMLTVRINRGNQHVRVARKDQPSKRALLKFVEARKRHLKYLKRESPERYFALIAKLGIKDTINLVPPRTFLPAEAQRAALDKELRKQQDRKRVADEKAATIARGEKLRAQHRAKMEQERIQDEAHQKQRDAAQEAVDTAAAEEPASRDALAKEQ